MKNLSTIDEEKEQTENSLENKIENEIKILLKKIDELKLKNESIIKEVK